MSRAAGLVLAALVLVLVPASAGAGTTRPSLALTATPARLSIVGSATATIEVTNPGRSPVAVDADRTSFALDPRGRPKVLRRGGARTAASWVGLSPARFLLPAGASRTLTVSTRLPRRVEPGDHDALVLLTTRPRKDAGVAVRMRLGVVVVVRAPGRVVRGLSLGGLRVRRARRGSVLELWVANRGNVTESLARGRVRLTLSGGATSTRLLASARELRPRTRGIVQFPYRVRLRGWVTAHASIAASPGRPAVRRSFRIRL